MSSQDLYLAQQNIIPLTVSSNENSPLPFNLARRYAKKLKISLRTLQRFEAAYFSHDINPHILYTINDQNFRTDRDLVPLDLDFLEYISQQKEPVSIMEVMTHFYNKTMEKITPCLPLWQYLIKHQKIKPASGSMTDYLLRIANALNSSNTQNKEAQVVEYGKENISRGNAKALSEGVCVQSLQVENEG